MFRASIMERIVGKVAATEGSEEISVGFLEGYIQGDNALMNCSGFGVNIPCCTVIIALIHCIHPLPPNPLVHL